MRLPCSLLLAALLWANGTAGQVVVPAGPGPDAGTTTAAGPAGFRYGERRAVHVDIPAQAEWTSPVEGRSRGRLTFSSPGASSLTLLFDDLYLPNGCTMHVVAGEQERRVRPPEAGHQGLRPSPMVLGDSLTVVLEGPSAVIGDARVVVQGVVDGTARAGGGAPGCFVDIACPEGDAWRDQQRAVVMFLREDGLGCSGVLLNNTAEDRTPYVQIANHCFQGPPADPSAWTFYFDFERPECASGQGPMDRTIIGAQRVAAGHNGDFSLMVLNEPVPEDFNAYFSGWDLSLEPPSNGAIIGHPLNVEKKIALYGTTTLGIYAELNTPAWFADIQHGGIEGGSSGSPLFNSAGRMVGHVVDGDLDCSGERSAIAMRMGDNWDGIGPTTRLRDWLDPANTGITQLDGLNGQPPQGDGIRLRLRAFLEGPLDPTTGSMRTDLADAGLIPLAEPYGPAGYPHQQGGGGETTSLAVLQASGPARIVDWVLVELRHPQAAHIVVASRSALLRADGRIVDHHGSLYGLDFGTVPNAPYHIGLRHRNHLGIMTEGSLPLDHDTELIDLSTDARPLYGTEAATWSGGLRCLWMGDANGNGVVDYQGDGNDKDVILDMLQDLPSARIPGYHRADVDLNGVVMGSGAANDRDRVLRTIGGQTPTSTRTEQFP